VNVSTTRRRVKLSCVAINTPLDSQNIHAKFHRRRPSGLVALGFWKCWHRTDGRTDGRLNFDRFYWSSRRDTKFSVRYVSRCWRTCDVRMSTWAAAATAADADWSTSSSRRWSRLSRLFVLRCLTNSCSRWWIFSRDRLSSTSWLFNYHTSHSLGGLKTTVGWSCPFLLPVYTSPFPPSFVFQPLPFPVLFIQPPFPSLGVSSINPATWSGKFLLYIRVRSPNSYWCILS